jgi:hypothetical protein
VDSSIRRYRLARGRKFLYLRNYSGLGSAETKRHTRPAEDHSRIEGARSNGWAECQEHNFGIQPMPVRDPNQLVIMTTRMTPPEASVCFATLAPVVPRDPGASMPQTRQPA